MKKRIVLALTGLVTAVLVACGADHPGEHCVHTHQETIHVNGMCLIWSKIGNTQVCTYYQQIPIQTTVCDTWAPDDPSTVTPTKEKHQ